MSWIFSAFLLAQTTYYGPTMPAPLGAPSLVRVELLVYDDETQGGLQIEEVIFNEQSIALKPRDIHSYRGGGSFQLLPGSYTLQWKAERDQFIWPRTLQYKEQIPIDKKDLWIQIVIRGSQIEIN